LLSALRDSAVGTGEGKILRPHEPGRESDRRKISFSSMANPQSAIRNPQFDLVIVNLASASRPNCYAPLNAERLADSVGK